MALVQLGTACDMMGIGYDQLKPKQVETLIEAFPREGMQAPFLNLILREVRLRPAVVTNTWTSAGKSSPTLNAHLE